MPLNVSATHFSSFAEVPLGGGDSLAAPVQLSQMTHGPAFLNQATKFLGFLKMSDLHELCNVLDR